MISSKTDELQRQSSTDQTELEPIQLQIINNSQALDSMCCVYIQKLYVYIVIRKGGGLVEHTSEQRGE